MLAQTAELHHINSAQTPIREIPQNESKISPNIIVDKPPSTQKPVTSKKAPNKQPTAAPLQNDIKPRPLPGIVTPAAIKVPAVKLSEKPAKSQPPETWEAKALPEVSESTQVAVAAEYTPTEIELLTDEIAPPSTENKALTELVLDIEPTLTDETVTFQEESADIANLAIAETIVADEVIFDEEVMATFEQLLALFSLESETITEESALAAIPEPCEPYEAFVEGSIVLLNMEENPETGETTGTNAFQEFIAQQPQPEVVPDIETILVSANGQTLEATLVQLSSCLAEAPQDSIPANIETALAAIVEALALSNTDSTETETILTPELTQKLLTLLRTVGYDNPSEVLIEFSTRHSLEFLLQAVQHLYQLTNDNNRQEFLSKLAVNLNPSQADEPLSARLGKAIVRYFFWPRATGASQA